MLRTLIDADVRFVLIGGQAATVQGSTTISLDLDIVYARDHENLERLARVLRTVNATLRGVKDRVPFRLDARTLHAGLNFTFTTRYGPFDCLGEAGDFDYDRLRGNANVYEIAGVPVPVAALDDLIAMKRQAGRRKDLIEVENLSALRDELRKQSRTRTTAQTERRRTPPGDRNPR
jgi:hypothetical protein